MNITDSMIREDAAIGASEALAACKRLVEEKDELVAALMEAESCLENELPFAAMNTIRAALAKVRA